MPAFALNNARAGSMRSSPTPRRGGRSDSNVPHRDNAFISMPPTGFYTVFARANLRARQELLLPVQAIAGLSGDALRVVAPLPSGR